MARRIAVLIWVFLILSPPVNSQIKNKYDVHLKYGLLMSELKFQEFFINDFGNEMPTVVGNIKNVNSLNAGLLFSKISYYFQPGLTINYAHYLPNQILKKKYESINFETVAIGIGGKVNFMKYGAHILTPYLCFNLGYEYNNLRSGIYFNPLLETSAPVDPIIQTFYQKTILSSNNLKPRINLGIGVEILINSHLFFITELNFVRKRYSGAFVEIPSFSTEQHLLFGVRYKLLKNKRYYLTN